MLYNSNQIQAILPHRYPFLLVDTIEEIIDNTEIIGKKCVSVNEPYFQGHFPEEHIMPGVLIMEALAQTGAVLLLSQTNFKGQTAYFAGLDKVRFKKPVRPGDVLILKVKLIKQRGSIGFAHGEALVNEELVASGDFMFKVGM